MRTCLITGASGFIGSSIAARLKVNGDKVIAIERDTSVKRDEIVSPDVIVKGDIRDYNLIRRVVADYEIEEVYHCAAQAIVRTCANDPYTTYDINIMGTVALLEACRNSGGSIQSIVVSTSDKAFGHAPIPYTEATPLNPLYTYETSKACQQLITQSYFHNYGLPTKVVACSNVYGPGDPNLSRIIPSSIMRLAQGDPAILYEGVDKFIREFVFITDVSSAFIAVARRGDNGGVYCCGGTEHCSMGDLMKNICHIMGKDPETNISIVKKSSQFKEIESQYIDSTKLRGIGWEPQMPLEWGLAATVDYYSKIAKERK